MAYQSIRTITCVASRGGMALCGAMLLLVAMLTSVRTAGAQTPTASDPPQRLAAGGSDAAPLADAPRAPSELVPAEAEPAEPTPAEPRGHRPQPVRAEVRASDAQAPTFPRRRPLR